MKEFELLMLQMQLGEMKCKLNQLKLQLLKEELEQIINNNKSKP